VILFLGHFLNHFEESSISEASMGSSKNYLMLKIKQPNQVVKLHDTYTVAKEVRKRR
jgi:hypothetical protein